MQLSLTSYALPMQVTSIAAVHLCMSSSVWIVCLRLHPQSFLYPASCVKVSTIVSEMDFCNVVDNPYILPSRRTNTEVEDDQEHDSAEERIPTAWWVGGLVLSGAFCTAMLTPMLDLPLIDPLAAVGLALLVAVLAVRALGQTDLNPVSGVGKLSQVCCLGCGHSHPWARSRKEKKRKEKKRKEKKRKEKKRKEKKRKEKKRKEKKGLRLSASIY